MTTTRFAGPVALEQRVPIELYAAESAAVITSIHVTSKATFASFTLYVSASMDSFTPPAVQAVDGTEFVALQKVERGKDYDWQGTLPLGTGEAIVAVANDDGLVITICGS